MAYYHTGRSSRTSRRRPTRTSCALFTMSKPSGHAGSRLGWALIRDENVANKASKYVHDMIASWACPGTGHPAADAGDREGHAG
ncbi:unnamed protein product [Urochloa humidicola]